ncbi:MAG: ribosome silencing factor [Verrucomicrobiota bacterium]
MSAKPKNKTVSAVPAASRIEPPALLVELVRALDAKKAENLRVLHVGAQSSITDWLVLATGGSEPHLRALRIEVERILDAAHAPIAGTDGGEPGSGWTVVDAYQIMAHLFTPAQREHYALERLWRDAVEIATPDLLAPPPKAPAPRKQPVRHKPTAKKPKKPAKSKAKISSQPKRKAVPVKRRKES